ncbi:hypothetical protein ABEB36_013628 [Hypothenemus hampei]|uniref:MBD domain-containing protein n=1 Tax=Hypothenemus hampei TaxID=57062 RepID=A0ABD1E4T7_HYPHA
MEAKDCEPPKSSNESEVLDSNVETKSVQQSDSNDASNDRQQTKASEPTENGELAANVDKQANSRTSNTTDIPVRNTRGMKRKADIDSNKNETTTTTTTTTTISEANPKIIEQKENADSKLSNEEIQKENETKDESQLTSLASSDVMGKGKRARIPNKRYSDIILTSNRKSGVQQKPSDAVESELNLKDLPAAEIEAPSSKRTRAILPKENLQDPKYLKPFKYGWRRELVWRSTNSPNSKRIGDIYYYNPNGKKVRSIRELGENLPANKTLTLDNFSFNKEPLGIDDPEKEMIRDAKFTKFSDDRSSPVSQVIQESTDTSTSKKVETRKPKKKIKNEDTIKTEPEPVTSRVKRKTTASPTANIPEEKKEPVKETFKKRMSLRGKQSQSKKPKIESKNEESTETSPATSPRAIQIKTSKPCQPCSIRCEGLQGIVPTLQCRLCLCLYHHECVGLSPNTCYPYVCKNCHDQGQDAPNTMSSPPPLKPINSLKSVTVSPNAIPPKLQRIPRPDSVIATQNQSPQDLPTSESLTESNTEFTKAGQFQEGSIVGPKSLVGSVTSWLPHNVKIINNQEPSEVSRPQYVEYLGGRKFLVIPKHNFMSVSSRSSVSRSEDVIVTPNAIQPPEVPISSASLGPDNEGVGFNKKISTDEMGTESAVRNLTMMMDHKWLAHGTTAIFF